MRIDRWSTAIALSLLAAAPVHACSKGAFAGSIGESEAFFTGVATVDTLLAGPGAVNYGIRRDDSEGGGERSIYGQLIRVDRLGGPAAEQISSNVEEVVVVPWGYDPSCRPLAWSASVQWVTPGAEAFYVATLRDPEHWVDGIPTFDLHNPFNLPYTGSERIREMDRDDPITSLLSPDQMFTFYQAIPTAGAIRTEGSLALGELRDWVGANPDLAARPPAETLVSHVLGRLSQIQLTRTDHPVLGTWRFTLEVPGDTTYAFVARTRSYPTSRWRPSRESNPREPGNLTLEFAEGYTVLFTMAETLSELPTAAGERGDLANWYLDVRAEPDSTIGERSWWRGSVESSLFKRGFPDNPILQEAAERLWERFSSRYEQQLPAEVPARLSREPDGVLRLVQLFPASVGNIVLTGRKISEMVVDSRRPPRADKPEPNSGT